jgi:hypothetical protein
LGYFAGYGAEFDWDGWDISFCGRAVRSVVA